MSEEEYVELLEDGELYNYIINLQQQLKGTTHCYDKEEHQKLKNQVEYWKTKYDELLDYKLKCEECLKYIADERKKIREHQYATGMRRLNKIEKILNGGDEERKHFI